MIFLGQQLIKSRLILDTITLFLTSYCIFIYSLHDGARDHSIATLLSLCCVTYATAGWTYRWTISFPLNMITFLALLLRMVSFPFALEAFRVLSVLIILLSVFLCIIFPVVELPPIKGRYNVTMVDLYIPVHTAKDNYSVGEKTYINARLIYPTKEPAKVHLPYLHPITALKICKILIEVALPAPLSELTCINHGLMLIHIYLAKPFAKPLDKLDEEQQDSSGTGKIPIAIFSHGLIGNSSMYTHQCLSLASNGTVVLQIEHTDKSAVGVHMQDGSFLPYDETISKLDKDRKFAEKVRARRKQMEHRIAEMITAREEMTKWNDNKVYAYDLDMKLVNLSFVGSLDLKNAISIGHSFGGGTAIAVVSRRPDLFGSVVALDPMTDWMPDDCRKDFFRVIEDKLKKDSSAMKYNGGTIGYDVEKPSNDQDSINIEMDRVDMCGTKESCSISKSVHNKEMLLLFSQEWETHKVGSISLIQHMHSTGKFGPNKVDYENKKVIGNATNGNEGNLSDVGIIAGMNHPGFSDVCMLGPVRILRAIGVIGKNNPIESADIISARIIDFVMSVQQKD